MANELYEATHSGEDAVEYSDFSEEISLLRNGKGCRKIVLKGTGSLCVKNLAGTARTFTSLPAWFELVMQCSAITASQSVEVIVFW